NWGVVSLIRHGEKDLSSYALKLILTPSGEVKFFNRRATGIDLAYSISRALGLQAEYILVDGVKRPLSYVLPNGSEVKVIVGKKKGSPDPQLLDYCLPSARKIILEQIADADRETIVGFGKMVVEEILKQEVGILDL